MALIVETGSGVTSADSYTTLVDAQAFIDLRGFSTSVLTEALLLRAMDVLNAVPMKGDKVLASNSLAWPRTGVYDKEGEMVLSTVVPDGIVNAQIWLAYYILNGDDPATVATPAVRSEQVDVISTTYTASMGSTTAITALSLPNVRDSLKGYTAASGLIDRA